MAGFHDDMMQRALNLSRERSESVLAESGTDLDELIANGEIEFGVSRTVYSVLGRLDPGELFTDFGVDLKAAIYMTKTAAFIEIVALLTSFVAAIFVFHWWSLGAIAAGFVLYYWGVGNNVTGGGGISLFIGIGGALAVLQSRSLLETVLAISWAVVGFCQWIRYQVPVRAVKRAALQSRSFMEYLVSADIAMLRRK